MVRRLIWVSRALVLDGASAQESAHDGRRFSSGCRLLISPLTLCAHGDAYLACDHSFETTSQPTYRAQSHSGDPRQEATALVPKGQQACSKRRSHGWHTSRPIEVFQNVPTSVLLAAAGYFPSQSLLLRFLAHVLRLLAIAPRVSVRIRQELHISSSSSVKPFAYVPTNMSANTLPSCQPDRRHACQPNLS